MRFTQASAALMLLSGASASPIVARETGTTLLPVPESTEAPPSGEYEWSAGWTHRYPIHHSCNATLRAQLEDALDETVQLAQHARDHLLRYGDSSDLVKKYFNGSTAMAAGWYDRVVAADKTGVLFRCDDPDKNCATQDNWAGHWRGENATAETVICDASFELRRPLSAVCGLGYTVAASPRNTYWATDLLHRVLHVPQISEAVVEHYADDYADVLRLAKEDPEKSAMDSNTLQYFAIEAWAYDIAAPGKGCTGEYVEEEEEEKPSPSSSGSPSTSSDAASSCHTHEDGVVHCT